MSVKGNMASEERRPTFVRALEGVVGVPYIGGGDDENGLDCSGTVRYCWIKAGYKMPDMTAQEMAISYWQGCRIQRAKAKPGDLFFYGNGPTQINHVMIVLRKWPNGMLVLAGARGGNAENDTLEEAYEQWAVVDIKPATYWKSAFQFVVDPFLKKDAEYADADSMDVIESVESLLSAGSTLDVPDPRPETFSWSTVFPWLKNVLK